ncbi:fibronectin type III domain-containing protein [Draconibacterium sp. IB214405]|uniref:golvesin C-terminal-like domain-containing protein n=1 Tax=Draconibacterium sp. IB214405 TaxID=3097352 RepID=UPI002A14D5D5|nr:fibronectin type III domain-containing protein [Draconibacterium sp. IB214405]MDX8340126.1 fibronectin type III domain-containing protein [Draconibacterium sp. IB214405]
MRNLNLAKSKILIENKKNYSLLFFLLFLLLNISSSAQEKETLKEQLNILLKQKSSSAFYSGDENYRNGKKVTLDTAYFSSANDTLYLHFNKALAEMPFRESSLAAVYDSIRQVLPDSLQDIPLNIQAFDLPLEELIPNYYRNKIPVDKNRLTPSDRNRKNVVKKIRSYEISEGLDGANIAMWNSHGWYYEPSRDRWEWQRARLFTNLEDISPSSFVIPFIIPMLENAGANVFNARERDWQVNEVVVDNDRSTEKSKFKKPRKRNGAEKGFAYSGLIEGNTNPFKEGTAVSFESRNKSNVVTYIPDFPEAGEYGVYVSYAKGDGPVTYRVTHSGAVTDFQVDQRMGYGTWIYLDKFYFNAGKDKNVAKVELIAPEGEGKAFSADAVRFGGGMGNIVRNGRPGGLARFYEGARYNLQYSGAPDTLVWNLYNGEDDYKDDYMSRGEWVDWLMGAPFGPTKSRMAPGLEIPIDLAFAFHTDAGILPDNKIVGTLGIYSTDRDTSVFPDGQSKYASRDLTDLIQTQIVSDINAVYKSNWTRRGMWNSQYSEAYRPQVPTMLLELLSHQNLEDAKYVLNPQFRFDVSRAIYKGMLRFVTAQNGQDYVVQPLPVDHLNARFTNENSVKLSWEPVLDELEPTSVSEKYMVYKRVGDNGFDNGTLVDKPEITIADLEPGKVYGFRVTAVNAGGESFPSETLAVGIAENSKGEVMIVNGFDRIDGPAIFETDSLAGVLRFLDHGVAYGYDVSTTGDQYDFERKSVWLDDDSPGFGASYADLETTIFRGNTFDFSMIHGKSLLANGYSFVTSSDEAVENGLTDLNNYKLVDLLYGEEKRTYLPGKDSVPYFEIYTEKMMNALTEYTKNGGNIFMSGAYVGTEIPKDKTQKQRIGNLFGFKWRTDHAVKSGQFYSVNSNSNFTGAFNTDYNLEQYPVEAPDGIEAFDKNGKTIFRYGENGISAGVLYKSTYKSVVLGFPFESVKGQEQRDLLMREILKMLND